MVRERSDRVGVETVKEYPVPGAYISVPGVGEGNLEPKYSICMHFMH